MAADWPTCDRALDPPCRGIQAIGYTACLAHLTAEELELFLAGLSPGASLDARGTTLSASLLTRVVDAVRDSDGVPVFGLLWCAEASLGDAVFNGARFSRLALFNGARFTGAAFFPDARFDGDADFDRAWFGGDTLFSRASFAGSTSFTRARFAELASFEGAQFDADTWFYETQFRLTAVFRETRFANAVTFGPVFAGAVDVAGALFVRTVDIHVDTTEVVCDGTRFEDRVNLNVRYGTVSASYALFGGLSSIASPGTRGREVWPAEPEWLDEQVGGRSERPTLLGLHGTDVSNLVLVDVDLSRCGFAGAHRLDQLRIEGRCEFGTPPPGWRWTKRQVLAEEAHWRDWPLESRGPSRAGPERLAAVYRSLRKAFEDSKYEAGAGDFYYGEMEMRRHSPETRRAERWILWVYWLLSGYGQRGGRALTALLVLIATVGVLLVGFGQPVGEAAKIAVGAVVLREAGTELTTAGEWTVMAARVLGPVLLALAVLAVRARVKR